MKLQTDAKEATGKDEYHPSHIHDLRVWGWASNVKLFCATPLSRRVFGLRAARARGPDVDPFVARVVRRSNLQERVAPVRLKLEGALPAPTQNAGRWQSRTRAPRFAHFARRELASFTKSSFPWSLSASQCRVRTTTINTTRTLARRLSPFSGHPPGRRRAPATVKPSKLLLFFFKTLPLFADEELAAAQAALQSATLQAFKLWKLATKASHSREFRFFKPGGLFGEKR